jgi:hypothetical protein
MENKVITLIGILVHDIEKTSQAYADLFGMEKPKWTMTDAVDKAQTEFRGKRFRSKSEAGVLRDGVA